MHPDTDDEGAHHREVYAHFGLAMYLAQVLENGLVNALTMFDFIPNHQEHIGSRTAWSVAFDAFSASKIELTMGNLINVLKKVTTVPDALEARLRHALHRRSFLVHHYFRDNVALFSTAEGRDRLIADLETYQAEFTAADSALFALVEPVMHRYGMTQDRLDEALAGWMAEVERGGTMPFQPAPPKK